MLQGLYKGDVDMNRVTAKVDKPLAGANLQAVLEGLRTDMRKAAENLEFERAAHLRDRIEDLQRKMKSGNGQIPMGDENTAGFAPSGKKERGRGRKGRGRGQRGRVPRPKRGEG